VRTGVCDPFISGASGVTRDPAGKSTIHPLPLSHPTAPFPPPSSSSSSSNTSSTTSKANMKGGRGLPPRQPHPTGDPDPGRGVRGGVGVPQGPRVLPHHDPGVRVGCCCPYCVLLLWLARAGKGGYHAHHSTTTMHPPPRTHAQFLPRPRPRPGVGGGEREPGPVPG
jgi:hypothetical protein